MIFTKGDWFESNLVELLKGVGGGRGGGGPGGGGGGGCKSCISIILAKFTIFNKKAHVVLKKYSLLAKIPLFRVLRGS